MELSIDKYKILIMRVLVMNRCIRPRTLHLRSERAIFGHWFHVHQFAVRPFNYYFL